MLLQCRNLISFYLHTAKFPKSSWGHLHTNHRVLPPRQDRHTADRFSRMPAVHVPGPHVHTCPWRSTRMLFPCKHQPPLQPCPAKGAPGLFSGVQHHFSASLVRLQGPVIIVAGSVCSVSRSKPSCCTQGRGLWSHRCCCPCLPRALHGRSWAAGKAAAPCGRQKAWLMPLEIYRCLVWFPEQIFTCIKSVCIYKLNPRSSLHCFTCLCAKGEHPRCV